MLLDVSDTLICNNRTNLYIGCNKYIYPKIHLQNWKQIHWDYFNTKYARKCYACHGSKEELHFHKWSDSIVVLKAKNMANMCQIACMFGKKCHGIHPRPPYVMLTFTSCATHITHFYIQLR